MCYIYHYSEFVWCFQIVLTYCITFYENKIFKTLLQKNAESLTKSSGGITAHDPFGNKIRRDAENNDFVFRTSHPHLHVMYLSIDLLEEVKAVQVDPWLLGKDVHDREQPGRRPLVSKIASVNEMVG